MRTCTLGILSDIHYAAAAEQARGHDFELRTISNPLLRALARFYRLRARRTDRGPHAGTGIESEIRVGDRT